MKKSLVGILVAGLVLTTYFGVSYAEETMVDETSIIEETPAEEEQEYEAYTGKPAVVTAKLTKSIAHYKADETLTVEYKITKYSNEDTGRIVFAWYSDQGLISTQYFVEDLKNFNVGTTTKTKVFYKYEGTSLTKGDYKISYFYDGPAGQIGNELKIYVDNGTHQYTNGYCVCGSIRDGFSKVNGSWGYYKGGKIQTTATGIVQSADNSKWYYVKNGVFTKATGIARKADGSSTSWYFVKDGVYTKSTGIAQKADKSSTSWYYVKDGLYTKETGISQKADGSSASWYYVLNGVYTQNTGIAQKADKSSAAWYYVKNGVFTKGSGVASKIDGSSTNLYYVKDGVYTKATGITCAVGDKYGTCYYVENGLFTKKTGLTSWMGSYKYPNGPWYYVQDGIYTKSTGISKPIDTSDTTWYFVYEGESSFEKFGITRKLNSTDTKWYYVSGGQFKKFTGIAPKADEEVGKYYVKDGVYTKYTGIVNQDYSFWGDSSLKVINTYKVNNGILNLEINGKSVESWVKNDFKCTTGYYIKTALKIDVSGDGIPDVVILERSNDNKTDIIHVIYIKDLKPIEVYKKTRTISDFSGFYIAKAGYGEIGYNVVIDYLTPSSSGSDKMSWISEQYIISETTATMFKHIQSSNIYYKDDMKKTVSFAEREYKTFYLLSTNEYMKDIEYQTIPSEMIIINK